MDVFAAKPNVHGVGTRNRGRRQAGRQVDFGFQVFSPEIEANYYHWTYYTLAKEFPRYPVMELRRVLHENNCWFAPSYKEISSDYTAALAAELRGEGRGPGRRRGHPKLNVQPRYSIPKPHEPCYIFEKELQSIQNASAKGAELATELKIDIDPQCRTQGETFEDRKCRLCGNYRDVFQDNLTSIGWECGTCWTHNVAKGARLSDASESDTSAERKCGCCGTYMDDSEGEAFADRKCGCCGIHLNAYEREISADRKCGCCGTYLEASEGETSTDRKCRCCETDMDASEGEAPLDIEGG